MWRHCWWTRARCRSRRGWDRPITGTKASTARWMAFWRSVLRAARSSPSFTPWRSIRGAASADDAARCAHVVRPVHAGELRRPFRRANCRRGCADPQPQHTRGVGFDAAQTAESLRIPTERGRQPLETRSLLRSGIGARRRRSHHGGTRRTLWDAGEPGYAQAVARAAIVRATQTGRRRAHAEPGGRVHYAGDAAPQSAPRRRWDAADAQPLAGGVEDRHVVWLSRCVVRGRGGAVRAGGLGRGVFGTR